MQLIRQADEAAIQKIAMAILFRYEELFPDWELAYLALPIDPAQRELALEAAFDQLRKYHK